jgi:hypothetical protein
VALLEVSFLPQNMAFVIGLGLFGVSIFYLDKQQ